MISVLLQTSYRRCCEDGGVFASETSCLRNVICSDFLVEKRLKMVPPTVSIMLLGFFSSHGRNDGDREASM